MSDRFERMLLGTTSLRTIQAVIEASESAELAVLRKAQREAARVSYEANTGKPHPDRTRLAQTRS